MVNNTSKMMENELKRKTLHLGGLSMYNFNSASENFIYQLPQDQKFPY